MGSVHMIPHFATFVWAGVYCNWIIVRFLNSSLRSEILHQLLNSEVRRGKVWIVGLLVVKDGFEDVMANV